MKIKRPDSFKITEDLMKKPLDNIIYSLIESCEIAEDGVANVDNTMALFKDELSALREKLVLLEKDLQSISNSSTQSFLVTRPNLPTIDLGYQHRQFNDLLQMVYAGLNVFLVGPAGSGKTTASINIAKALDVEFHFTGAIASEFKLTGFIDANGRIVSTEFRKAYEEGGLFLFDEIDASFPQAILAFNAALSNDYMDFPDRRIKKHEHFYCIAAANTYGLGADRMYIGRNQLDAASLDRFAFLNWEYDEEMEKMLTQNQEWVEFVQKVRRIVNTLKIKHVVSPRASIFGDKLLNIQIDRGLVEKTCLWKGLDETSINLIRTHMQTNDE